MSRGRRLSPALRAGATLRAFPYSSTFYDIGTVDRYLAANLGWLAARGLDHWADGGAQVAPGVRLDPANPRARLRRARIG